MAGSEALDSRNGESGGGVESDQHHELDEGRIVLGSIDGDLGKFFADFVENSLGIIGDMGLDNVGNAHVFS